MKQILLIVFLALFMTSYAQNDAWQNYPQYETILTKFFTKYSVPEKTEDGYLTFEKRKEGWFVCLADYKDNMHYYKKELLWDASTHLYRDINFDANPSGQLNKLEMERYLKKREAALFKIHPYYNYVGWDQDVIDLLKNQPSLDDTLLYSLARAYSFYATALISKQMGLVDQSRVYDLPYGENSMTDAQLQEYRRYRHLAIENFDKLALQNPKFETIVGSIQDKAACEYITSFYDLLVYQNEEEARKELKEGLFSDFTIANAKQFLISCRKNAVLFTYGDMDTFPLLYVQAYGFRPDVKVINLSLLNLDRYIDYVQRDVLGSKGVKLSFEPKDYRGEANQFLLFSDNTKDETMALDKLIDLVKTFNNESDVFVAGQSTTNHLPLNNFTFAVNKKAIAKTHLVDKTIINDLPDSISWKIKNHYLLRRDLIVLDIISTNNWKRPICFAITASNSSYLGLENYFALEGFAYCLTPIETKKSKFDYGHVNTSVMYDNVMNKFPWVKVSDGLLYDNSGEVRMGSNLRVVISRLAASLIDEGKNEKAEEVLKKCQEMIPFEVVPYDYWSLSIIESYYRLHKSEMARKLLIDCFSEQKAQIEAYRLLTMEEQRQANIKQAHNINRFFIQQLYIFADKYNDDEAKNYLNDVDYKSYME